MIRNKFGRGLLIQKYLSLYYRNTFTEAQMESRASKVQRALWCQKFNFGLGL
jgi:hypothetical protein